MSPHSIKNLIIINKKIFTKSYQTFWKRRRLDGPSIQPRASSNVNAKNKRGSCPHRPPPSLVEHPVSTCSQRDRRSLSSVSLRKVRISTRQVARRLASRYPAKYHSSGGRGRGRRARRGGVREEVERMNSLRQVVLLTLAPSHRGGTDLYPSRAHKPRTMRNRIITPGFED